MIEPHINNETGKLKSVILGIAHEMGGVPELINTYDPKSREHVISNTYPKEADLTNQLDAFKIVLDKYDVEVYRPLNLPETHQVYARDIGFVIGDKFIVGNIIPERKSERSGIDHILKQVLEDNLIYTQEDVRIEGGDVILYGRTLFVGYSKEADFRKFQASRTNEAGVNFLRQLFPEKNVIAIELNKSDDNALKNALHLDCCFQPIGRQEAIIYKGGFKNINDYEHLKGVFGKDNLIEITELEMYFMWANVFSISESVIVSGKSFGRLNNELRKRGYTVEEVDYDEVAKMEGLFRCSTLPLVRA